MVDTQKLKTLLDQMHHNIGEDLVALVVVDRDGLTLESSIKQGLDEDLISGMAGLVEPVLKRISCEFDSKNFGTGTFDTDEYRLIFCEAGPLALLVLVADSMASLDEMFPYAYLCAEKVSRIFDNRSVSPVIPHFSNKAEKNAGKNDLSQISIKSGDFILKTILGGEGGVGKTTLVTQFIDKTFNEDYKSTIGVSIMKKAVHFPEWDVKVNLTIFDLAGQSQYARVRQTYFSGAKAGLIIFDCTRKDTFEKIPKWHKEATRAEPNIMLMLVANKIDLIEKREVSEEEGNKLADELGMSYYETSAINKDIVDEAFKTLAFLFIREEHEVNNL